MSRPRIGQFVHYMAHGSRDGAYAQKCRAAFVTEVTERNDWGAKSDTPIIGLAVLNPTGMFFNHAAHAEAGEREGGTWHYECAAGARGGIE